eukprot:5723687-Amphidinium_carterae.1
MPGFAPNVKVCSDARLESEAAKQACTRRAKPHQTSSFFLFIFIGLLKVGHSEPVQVAACLFPLSCCG